MASLPRTLWLVLTLLLVAPVALAEAPNSDAEARAHFQAGRSYFSQALYQDAYREFAEAYRLSKRSTLLINMSRALEAAHQIEAAIEPLERWLAEAPPEDPQHDDVVNKLVRLQSEAERLKAERAAEPVPVAGPTPQAQPSHDDPSPRPAWLRPAAIALLSSGAALSATGVALIWVGRANIDRVESAKQGAAWSRYEDDHERGPRRVATGIAVLSVGAAALAGGLVAALVRRSSQDQPSANLSVGWGSLHVNGTF